MRKLQTKNITEVQRENNRKFDYYSEWIWDEKLLKSSRVWKNNQHGKVACLQQLSIGISLAQFRWVDGELRAKKHVKNRVKFRYTRREVQVLHVVHFRRICFAIKAERMISPFSELLENGQDSEKTINMKKFRIFHSFSAVYYLPHSDKVCRNYSENTFLAIFKIDLK